MSGKKYYSHPSAFIDDGCNIGEGTKIWHFSHIMTGCEIGRGCNIGQNVVVSPKVVLGNNVRVQNNVSIYEGVNCEDDVFLGPSMVFTNVINPRSAVSRKNEFMKTIVRKGASIGANATIICGNEIGEYAFIGAGAVVSKPVLPYALVVGNPARRIGWMSEYGHRLDFNENGVAVCMESGEKIYYKGFIRKNCLMVTHSQKIKFAVIGCGHIGKRHAEMIHLNPESELVALIDTRDKVDLNIDDYDIPFLASVDELLKSTIDVDVITIASPNGFHADHALKALEAKKHIVIEKPMSLTKADAEKIIYKALNVHRHVFTVMQNRYSPPSVWIKELIETDTIGKIFMVQLNCFWNRDDRYYKNDTWHGKKDLDGGTLFTQFSHFIDIMYWLFGDIDNIVSRITNHNHQHLTEFEDSGVVTFDFVNGGMGCLNFSTSIWDKNLESSMTVIAEKGSIKIGGQYMDKVEYCHVKDYTMPVLKPTNPGNDYGAYKGSAQNHHFVIDNVVDVLKGRATITTNALEGLKVVDIIERIYSKG